MKRISKTKAGQLMLAQPPGRWTSHTIVTQVEEKQLPGNDLRSLTVRRNMECKGWKMAGLDNGIMLMTRPVKETTYSLDGKPIVRVNGKGAYSLI